jgi:hypothetical protein
MILFELYSYYEKAKSREDLTPVERILLECDWTDSLLKLLVIGNSEVTSSIKYQLREQTTEANQYEDEMEN